MSRNGPTYEKEASPLDALPTAVAQRDPALLDAVFTPDADVIVHGMPAWSWAGGSERQAAWNRLLARTSDLAYVPERRYLSPEMHSEEGRLSGLFQPADGSGDPERFDISLRMVARLEADVVKRLEIWGDASGLPGSLRPLVGGGAAVIGSIAALRGQHAPAELRVLGTAQAPRDAAPSATEDAVEVAPAAPPDDRRPRRRALVAGLLALAVLAGLGTLALVRSPAPEPRDTVVADASAAPEPSAQPTEPAPSPVEATPSVPQIEEEAPSTAPQVQAGEQLVLASDVLFETGSSVLGPEATQALTDLSRRIRERQVTGTIQVNGYTDNTGSDAFDLALSRARALAVAQVLQQELAGVPVRLEPQGFGKADPVADNGTPEGRAQNRRVTIVLPEPAS